MNMENLSDFLNEECKRREDLWEIKLHENGCHNIIYLKKDIDTIKDKIDEMRSRLLDNIRTFIYDCVSSKPVSIDRKITLKEGNIYSYNDISRADLSSLLSIDQRLVTRKISDEEKVDKVSQIFDLLKENQNILERSFEDIKIKREYDNELHKFSFSDNNIIRHVSNSQITTLNLKEMPPEKESSVLFMIKYSKDIISLLEKIKDKLLYLKLNLRNLLIKISEIKKIGAETEVSDIYQIEGDNYE